MGDHINNVVFDLETYGISPDAVILQIAAAFVNDQGELVSFSTPVSVVSQPNRHQDPNTVAWWAKQTDKAKDLVLAPALDAASPTLPQALDALTNWLLTECKGHTTTVWGNGAVFDLGKLNHAYMALGRSLPWHFRLERDQRTLEAIAAYRGIDLRWEADPRVGEHHDAASDAAYQARRIHRIWQALTSTM